MKFEFEDKSKKAVSSNNLNPSKAESNNLAASKINDFNFNFSMESKPEIKQFEQHKNAFDNNVPANKNSDGEFGFYPAFDKKEEPIKGKKGWFR